MIRINDVSFGYTEEGDTLKNINLHIRSGECVLLCGKSGCGKTTITKMINGLIPHFTPDCHLSGSIEVAGMDVPNTELYQLSKKIGSVFQNPKSQFFNVDSDSELAFGLENEGARPELIEQRIKKTVKDLKIERLRHRNIFKMSGGEKQNLAFASVYAMDSDIYVLDEPTANLDARAIEILKEQIAQLKKLGKTILIADHRLYYLTDLIDKAIYIDNGEIVDIYSREEFLSISIEDRVKMGLRTLYQDKIDINNCQGYPNKNELIVKDLTCAYKNETILKGISFNAYEGEIIGITGYNGTGKTTLVRCIAGLIKEKRGKIILDGKVLNTKQRNKACYMIMQDVNHQLFGDSVWNECEISGYRDENQDIDKVLLDFDLLEYKESHPMALSGGQKQRLAIATGVLTNKKILIFDEPTSGLDYYHMIAVSRTIQKLKEGHIILIITHDMEFLEVTCDRTIDLTNKE